MDLFENLKKKIDHTCIHTHLSQIGYVDNFLWVCEFLLKEKNAHKHRDIESFKRKLSETKQKKKSYAYTYIIGWLKNFFSNWNRSNWLNEDLFPQRTHTHTQALIKSFDHWKKKKKKNHQTKFFKTLKKKHSETFNNDFQRFN